MKKITQKIAILFIAFLGVFFYFQTGQATDIISIDNYNQDNLYGPGYSVNAQKWGQSFIALSTNISGFSIINANIPASASCGDSCTYYIKVYDLLATATPLVAETFIRTNADGTQQDFFFSHPVSLNTGADYKIEWESASASADNFGFEATLDNDGNFYGGCLMRDFECQGTDRDSAFKIYYSDSFSFINYINAETPKNGSTYTSPVEFTGYYTNNGLYDQFAILIGRASTTTPEWFYSYDIIEAEDLPYTHLIDLTNGSYWYAPYMYNETTGATSFEENGYDINDFILRYSFKVGDTASDVDNSSIYDNVLEYCQRTISTSTNPLIKYVVEGFKDAMCITFIPSRDFIEDLATTSNEFKHQAPIGYIPIAIEAWSSLATTANATTAPPIILELGGSEYYGLWQQISEWGIFYYFKLILDLLIIVFIVLYIYKRIRRLIKV